MYVDEIEKCMLELAVMAQSVSVMQEAITEVGVVNGPARDEVHLMLMLVFMLHRYLFWWELKLVVASQQLLYPSQGFSWGRALKPPPPLEATNHNTCMYM